MTELPSSRLENARILIYSHDTFGLGHLRRCRAIAHEIVDRYKGVSVLIVSGSPVIGSFEFKARVDFIRIPGIIKLQNGEYTSLSLHIDLSETLAIRESIIRQTAKIYAPDLFIVDKEPLGLHGEVRNTLQDLKVRGVKTVLGLRDILDEKQALLQEWTEKQVFPNIDSLYDEIWIYGLREFYQPLQALPLPDSVYKKIIYTGYLQRSSPGTVSEELPLDSPYILVTPGGGRDGTELVDLVLTTHKQNPDIPYHLIIVLGPFMHADDRARLKQQTESNERIILMDFYARMETLIDGAIGIIAMGGYNTFCEIISFDKPALLFPRTSPRAEQLIRCQRADELGLIKLLNPDTINPDKLKQAILVLEQQSKPSDHLLPGMLDGMDVIAERTLHLLPDKRVPPALTDNNKMSSAI